MSEEPKKRNRSHRPIRKFTSHEKADSYNREQILAMTPVQRLELINQLRNQYWQAKGGCEPRLRRVYRKLKSPWC